MAVVFPGLNFKPSKTGRNFNAFFIIAAAVIVTTLVITLFFWKPGSGIPKRGTWGGRTYSNSETGVFMTVPDGWQIMSDADMIKNFEYVPNIYENLQSYSDYVDTFMQKPDDSKLYIRYYSPGTAPCSALKEAQRNVRLLGSSVKYKNARFKVNPEAITTVEVGGVTYERFAYTLSGIDNAKFIEYYRCLEGDTGEKFVQMNLTVFDQTSEEEFLAMFR